MKPINFPKILPAVLATLTLFNARHSLATEVIDWDFTRTVVPHCEDSVQAGVTENMFGTYMGAHDRVNPTNYTWFHNEWSVQVGPQGIERVGLRQTPATFEYPTLRQMVEAGFCQRVEYVENGLKVTLKKIWHGFPDLVTKETYMVRVLFKKDETEFKAKFGAIGWVFPFLWGAAAGYSSYELPVTKEN